MNDPVYLDHNVTTPVTPEVADAIEPYLRGHSPERKDTSLPAPSNIPR